MAPAIPHPLEAFLLTVLRWIKRPETKAQIAKDRAKGMTENFAMAIFLYTLESAIYGFLFSFMSEDS